MPRPGVEKDRELSSHESLFGCKISPPTFVSATMKLKVTNSDVYAFASHTQEEVHLIPFTSV